MPITVWKTGLENEARNLRVLPLGRPSFRGLCWGMKISRASAWISYFSKVQAVRSSHFCFCSHQSAWSDQSCLISVEDTQRPYNSYTKLTVTSLSMSHMEISEEEKKKSQRLASSFKIHSHITTHF